MRIVSFKYIILSILFLLNACDTSQIDCIDPDDFGNIVSKTLTLETNPYIDGETSYKDNPDGTYGNYKKNCSGTDISKSSRAYFWLDTGIDVVSLDDKVRLSAIGSADFCAQNFDLSGGDSVEECNSATTFLFAHNLNDAEQEMYGLEEQDTANFQPSNPSACSLTPSPSSTITVEDSNDFYIIIPRVFDSPYKTDEEIEEMANYIIENMDGYDGDIDDLVNIYKKANTHSESGRYSIAEYNESSNKKEGIITEGSNYRAWYKRGERIKVKIGDSTYDLNDTSKFERNPSNISIEGVNATYNQNCCFEYDELGNCTRIDTEENRGYFDLEITEDTEGVDTTLYNYCEQDVFHYKGPKVSGSVKFKIKESFDTDEPKCSNLPSGIGLSGNNSGNSNYEEVEVNSDNPSYTGRDFFYGSATCTDDGLEPEGTGSNAYKGGEGCFVYRKSDTGTWGYCFIPDATVDFIPKCDDGKYYEVRPCRAEAGGQCGTYNECGRGLHGDDVYASAMDKGTYFSGCYKTEWRHVDVNVPTTKLYKTCYTGEPRWTNSYDDNYGIYTITVKTPQTCVIGPDGVVAFAIHSGGGNVISDSNIRVVNEENGFIDNEYDDLPWNTGRVYVRVIDQSIAREAEHECAYNDDTDAIIEKYRNNVGSFIIKIRTVKEPAFLTRFKNDFLDIFGGVFDKEFKREFFENLVGSGSLFQNVLTIMLVMYVAFTGAYFILGMADITQSELLARIMKIGLIYLFVSPASWDFFVWIIYVFEEGAEELASIMVVNFDPGTHIDETTGGADPYYLVDQVIYMLTQDTIWKKISAVFFSPIAIGVILFLMILYSIFLIFYAVARSIIIYLVIKIMLTILTLVGPIFIIFSLFERTKGMFENWLGAIISYSIQLIFLFLAVSFFSYMILNIFYNVFYFGICWKTVWNVVIPDFAEFDFFEWWRFHGFDARYSNAYNVSKGPDIAEITVLLIFAYIFREFIDKVGDLGDQISGGGGIGAGSLAGNAMNTIFSAVGGFAKKAWHRAIKPMGKAGAFGLYAGAKGSAIAGGLAAQRAVNIASWAKDQASSRSAEKKQERAARRQAKEDRIKDSAKNFANKMASGEEYRKFKDAGQIFKGKYGKERRSFDNKVDNAYKSAISDSMKDASTRLLSKDQAKENAQNLVATRLKALGVPKSKLDQLVNRAGRDIDKKDLEYGLSTRKTSDSDIRRVLPGGDDSKDARFANELQYQRESIAERQANLDKYMNKVDELGKSYENSKADNAKRRFYEAQMQVEEKEKIKAEKELVRVERDIILQAAEDLKKEKIEFNEEAREKAVERLVNLKLNRESFDQAEEADTGVNRDIIGAELQMAYDDPDQFKQDTELEQSTLDIDNEIDYDELDKIEAEKDEADVSQEVEEAKKESSSVTQQKHNLAVLIQGKKVQLNQLKLSLHNAKTDEEKEAIKDQIASISSQVNSLNIQKDSL